MTDELNYYTQREWDRVVGWGTVPKEYQRPNKLAPGEGFEPPSLSAHEKQSCVFTSFTTPENTIKP